MRKYAFAKFTAILLSTILLTSCYKVLYTHSQVLNRYKTKDQVLRAFGVPAYKNGEGNYEEWTYDFGSTNVTRSSANAYNNYYGGVSANGTTTNQTYNRYVKYTFNGDWVARVTSSGVDYTEYTAADMTWLKPSMNYDRECLIAVNFVNPSLFLEYYFKDGKYATRMSYWKSISGVDYGYGITNYYKMSTTSDIKNISFDFYRIINYKKTRKIHSYFGPSMTIMKADVTSTIDSLNSYGQITQHAQNKQNKLYIYPNVRFGFETALNNRIGINLDFGYGYSTMKSTTQLSTNVSLGYRFSPRRTYKKLVR